MALLTLGDVELVGFEVPPAVGFGGAQQLAVHRLIGGVRIVDVMGPDDASIRWSGVFSGANAGDRARLFDAMRVAGQPLDLVWDEFCYSVIIEQLKMDFCNPWWIPYQISCTVVVDQAQAVAIASPALADSLLSDLTTASAYANVSSALAATALPNALIEGNAQYTNASLAVAAAATTINTQIGAIQPTLNSADLATLVSASGSLAQLCVARGYVERCANNLTDAGS